ncbi:MAG: flagellar biosynthesis protein FlgN [Alphaproteobacteria bacterium HGW-Alphaproteobacteria-2]|nr:MAG: flagellar biosynthesis protein FlgN [Alphaproteobacteria bacterium HGW-Alphaproteobacteria-2]
MLLDRVEALLEDERAALLAGRLDRLAPLLAEKERLADLLGKAPAGRPDRLARLARLAARNQALIEAALGGLRRAAARAAACRGGVRQLDTYDAQGARQSFAFGRTRLERRV